MLGNNFLKKNFTFSFILILKVNFKLKNFFTNTYKKNKLLNENLLF